MSRMRALLIDAIENMEEDYHVTAPMGREHFADAIMADEAFEHIKAYETRAEELTEDSDLYAELCWALYDYAENEFAFRGLIN